MENARLGQAYFDADTEVTCYTDEEEYELECKHIWNVIGKHYNYYKTGLHKQASGKTPMGSSAPTSPGKLKMKYTPTEDRLPDPTDGSPSLLQMYYDIMAEMLNDHRPRSKWLKYETQLGYYLFAMLVGIKLRRYAEEWAKDVVGTEGWHVFENGMSALQRKIIAEVREDEE
jgi:hypothetical protein